MTRAEDLRAMRRALETIHHDIGAQLMKLESLIRLAENGAPVPVLNPGRRADDMPLPPAAPRVDGVMLGVFDSMPRETPVLVGMGDEGDDWHGVTNDGCTGYER